MLVGYNTNISYKDTVYHVQTEDSGQQNPVIVSLIYSQGAIIASKKTSYAHIAHDPDFAEKVSKIMKVQHKYMIRELLAGKFTGEDTREGAAGEANGKAAVGEDEAEEAVPESHAPAETTSQMQADAEEKPQQPPPQPAEGKAKNQLSKSLDDILLNYIMKREKQ